jgi:N-acetylglucosamine kinase-like BadF-type ATPase
MSYCLGVDVGGTCTDVLLVDEQAGSTWRAKTTSGCVRASATDAMQHGFRPIVVGEACGGPRPFTQANLADLAAK